MESLALLRRFASAGALLAGLAATPAGAQAPDGGASAPSPAPAAASLWQPVDSGTLSGLRGGAQVVTNDQTLAGTTAGNTARNVSTGDNTISAGSFANMSGLPVVIQNSGANVLIQNALIVHVQMD